MQKLKAVRNATPPTSRRYRDGESLETMAARLWPESEHNRNAWMRSVTYLRSFTPSKWKLDGEIPLSWVH